MHNSYYELSGVVNPLAAGVAEAGNPLWHYSWGDSFYIFGGCPLINSFDVLDKWSGGGYAVRYPDFDGQQYYAGIFSNGIRQYPG